MEYIAEWYDHIIPIINEFDNVILFQIENEYATDTMEEDYMLQLYKMARERGITCPIFHNDAYLLSMTTSYNSTSLFLLPSFSGAYQGNHHKN